MWSLQDPRSMGDPTAAANAAANAAVTAATLQPIVLVAIGRS